MYKVHIKFRCGNEVEYEVDADWVCVDSQTGQIRHIIGNQRKLCFAQDDVLYMTVEKIE